MKKLIASLAALMMSQAVLAEVSAPFQMSTANYNDYRGVKTPVIFLGFAKIQPNQVENFKAIADSFVNIMRAQAGNVSYDYHQSLSDSTEFFFVEEWESGKALADHMDSKAVGQLVSQVGPLFAQDLKIVILNK
jgi:quinol monooxygenase YgiN